MSMANIHVVECPDELEYRINNYTYEEDILGAYPLSII